MSSNKDDTLRQFCDVTGADEGRSRFFLESSNWQLEVALSSFYEHGGNVDEAPTNTAATASMPTATLSDSDMDSPPASPVKPQKKDKKKAPSSKFATLDSLQQESSSEEEEAKSKRMNASQEFSCDTCCMKDTQTNDEISSETLEDEIDRLKREVERLLCENSELRKEIATMKNETDTGAGQAFYAGGSERSGQQILGPGKGRKDIVTEMFKSVRERGAVVFEDEPSSTSRGRGGHFSGVGYRLGQTADDHEQVTPQNAAAAAAAAQQQESSRSVRLRLYREGFTVDQGSLRLYTDPENTEFLFCIRRGEIPPELAAAGGGEVRVSLEDRRHEDCPKTVAKAHAFSGKGQMLGSPTPPVVGAPAPPVSAPSSPADREASQREAQAALQLQENQPITTIQFRLADGSRLTGRFNHSHTVGDVRRYVAAFLPAGRAFALLTAFPSAELADDSATVTQANLLNATLLQRLK